MTANSAKVQSVIENTFTSVIREFANNESGSIISDLYVHADPESGELQIYDEDETLLDKVVIFDWMGSKEDEDSFNKKAFAITKSALTILASKNLFNNPCFLKPFSVSQVDDDFIVIEELLFLDDDTFRLDDPLLKDLDKDLDDFLEDLLSDIPK